MAKSEDDLKAAKAEIKDLKDKIDLLRADRDDLKVKLDALRDKIATEAKAMKLKRSNIGRQMRHGKGSA